VSGQTFPLTVNKIADQFQQVTVNLGEQPDILAIAPRRYGALEMGTGALGPEVNSVVPVGMDLRHEKTRRHRSPGRRHPPLKPKRESSSLRSGTGSTPAARDDDRARDSEDTRTGRAEVHF
jgi:hypothetical protein